MDDFDKELRHLMFITFDINIERAMEMVLDLNISERKASKICKVSKSALSRQSRGVGLMQVKVESSIRCYMVMEGQVAGSQV